MLLAQGRAATAGFVHHSGYIPLGDDCFNTSGSTTTVAAALKACTADPCCAAFTYHGTAKGPSRRAWGV